MRQVPYRAITLMFLLTIIQHSSVMLNTRIEMVDCWPPWCETQTRLWKIYAVPEHTVRNTIHPATGSHPMRHLVPQHTGPGYESAGIHNQLIQHNWNMIWCSFQTQVPLLPCAHCLCVHPQQSICECACSPFWQNKSIKEAHSSEKLRLAWGLQRSNQKEEYKFSGLTESRVGNTISSNKSPLFSYSSFHYNIHLKVSIDCYNSTAHIVQINAESMEVRPRPKQYSRSLQVASTNNRANIVISRQQTNPIHT